MGFNKVVAMMSCVFFFSASLYAGDSKPAGEGSASLSATTPVVGKTNIRKNLNQANEKELLEVTGITSAKAKAILAYRKANGNFVTIEDLSKVKGFKRMKAEKLKAIQEQFKL